MISGLQQLPWTIGNQEIPYLLGHDCLSAIAEYILQLAPDKTFLITDERVAALHGNRIYSYLQPVVNTELLVISEGEQQKSLSTLEKLAERALYAGVSRQSIIIAMGGGVIGNLAGLLAALLFRGIRLVHIPTTLLAMHDSVTSQKQAINLANVKNVLGVYHPPIAICVDIRVLNTLPDYYIRAGMIELAKNALVFGGHFLDRLFALLPSNSQGNPDNLEQLVRLGVEAKYQCLGRDPFEKEQGIVFEYGHTVGHALELSLPGRVTHGAAVAWGMICAAYVSYHLGYLSSVDFAQHHTLIEAVGSFPLPDCISPPQAFFESLVRDNKRGYTQPNLNQVPMVLLEAIGKVIRDRHGLYLVDVPLSLVKESVDYLWRHNHRV